MSVSELKAAIEDLIARISDMLHITVPIGVTRKTLKSFYDLGLKEMEVQFKMNFTRDPERLSLLESFTIDNIKDLNESMSESLRKEITQGVVNLESLGTIEKRVAKVTRMSKARARTIARTETNRALGVAHKDAALQSGLNLRKMVDATIDAKTSSICKGLQAKYGREDQTIPINQKFKFNGQEWDTNPFHPNCRSRVVYVQVDKVKKEDEN